jgi:hypothetical protein
MKKHYPVIFVVMACVIFACGCSGISPVTPQQDLTAANAHVQKTNTHLWGLYDVYIDIPTQTATAVLNRDAMFTANVVNFLNGKTSNLGFKINGTPVGTGYVDVDIDVSITHPFPGLSQYDGNDVRGVFMGEGSAVLNYNPELIYAVHGTDQSMLPDPDDNLGGPDGYTRWFNKPEFSGTMPLFSHTQGKLATPGYNESATLNPYKYFADGLGATDDLWSFLKDTDSGQGQFSSGVTNTRNYYLRFPTAKGVKYSYAVLATWKGALPEDHPSNCPEAIAVDLTNSSNLYFVDQDNKGGALKLDIGVWDWDSVVSAGVMEDYKLFIESTVHSAPVPLSLSEMTPTSGGDHYSTYHVEIFPDNITGNSGNELWIIAEQTGFDYTNDFGVTNLADTDPVAAIFRYDLKVSNSLTNHDPVCDLVVNDTMPLHGWDVGVPVHFDASGSTDADGDTLAYEWDFDGDGVYGEAVDDSIDSGTSAMPVHNYKNNYNGQACVRVTDGQGGKSDCCQSIQVVAHQSKNIPLRTGVVASDIAVSHTSGYFLVLYSDNQVWKYSASKWYAQADASLFYTIPYSGMNYIDIDQVDNSVVGGYPSGGSYIRDYSPTGGLLGNYSIWCAGATRDVGTVPGSGNHANNHCWVFGFYPGNYNVSCFFEVFAPSYSNPSNQWVITIFPPYNGYDKYNSEWVKGMEMISNDSFWAVEGLDYYAGLFQVPGEPNIGSAVINYNGAYCGTGVPTDSDDGFNEPLDLTVDSDGRVFVLDELSTSEPRVKVFEPTGEPAASDGSFGNTTNINGDPLRLEGSSYVDPNYGNLMYVLHGSTAPSKVSVFFPSEMP